VKDHDSASFAVFSASSISAASPFGVALGGSTLGSASLLDCASVGDVGGVGDDFGTGVSLGGTPSGGASKDSTSASFVPLTCTSSSAAADTSLAIVPFRRTLGTLNDRERVDRRLDDDLLRVMGDVDLDLVITEAMEVSMEETMFLVLSWEV
jgi:hypothetical protein